FTTQGGVPHRVAISPDGKSLIYLQRFKGENSLWLGQIETNNSVPIYQKPDLTTTNPAFAPDGNSVYFIVKGDDRPQAMLVRMPILGGVLTELIRHIDSAPVLSPDGKQLAFLRNETRVNQRSIIIADAADGKNERTLVSRNSPDNFSSEGL